MASSSSSSRNWVYDVFVSFRGTDVRDKFLSHFQKELDRKLIKTFIDERIKKGQSIDPVLKEAIRTSRIAVVVFSENYASSSWCLDELVEIVKCKKDLGQLVIPIFYGVDPTHVRKQTGKFGQVFAKTCQKKSKKKTKLWRQSLTKVANLCGNHPQNWANEAKMVEEIVNDVLDKILNSIPRKDFGNFVGMEDHIVKMIELLHLESQEVRMVGIWGCSGIGKTSIARTLYSQISHRFQCKIFIEKAFVSNVMKKYENANPYDPNMKLHLLRSFLSEILEKKDIKIDSFDAMRQMLKHHKVLIFIDDLDHQEVLDTLVGETQWFGCGSRIIVITQDQRFLRAHGIDHIYEVCLPSTELACEMFCKSAFRKYPPPDSLIEFSSKIALSAGKLPLGLHVLGSYVRGIEKDDLIEMLPDLLKDLNGDIEKTLKVSYDGLSSAHKAIFRHIACFFHGEKVKDVEQLLADSNLYVKTGLRNLVDKALIHIRYGRVEMHSLLQKMGKEIVRAQSTEPGKREFLVDTKDICDVLENNTGTNEVLGIALDMDELHIHELRIHESAFEKMPNLLFLKVYTKDWYQKTLTTKWDKEKGVRWILPEGFDYLPQKLRLLSLERYPMRCMPSSFCPENLVKLDMRGSKLEKLWEGVHTLNGLKKMNLRGSIYLKEIPDLSKATNLEKLVLVDCSCLVELPFSIKYLNKLEYLNMWGCSSLETLPNGINLQSLDTLILNYCPRLNSFPDISTNTSALYLGQGFIDEARLNLSGGNIGMNIITSETLWGRAQPYSLRELHLKNIPSLVELPSSIKNFIQLEELDIRNCINLETLSTDINFCSLRVLSFKGCSRLRIFPNISTNIEELDLSETGIEEVPWWIEKFTKLETIKMSGCSKLVRVYLNIYKLKLLEGADFSWCKALREASWNDHPIANDEVISGVEVPSHFIHQTSGSSLTNIPLRPTSLSQQLFACVVVVFSENIYCDDIDIEVHCEFKDRIGNSFLWVTENKVIIHYGRDSVVFVIDSPLDECNATQAQLNYDHVDMEIHIYTPWRKLKRWGVQLLDEFSSPMTRLRLLDVPHVYEDNSVSESEHNEECIQRVGKRQRETRSLDLWDVQLLDNMISESEHNEERERNRKRQRETGSLDFWEKPFKKMFSYVRKFF